VDDEPLGRGTDLSASLHHVPSVRFTLITVVVGLLVACGARTEAPGVAVDATNPPDAASAPDAASTIDATTGVVDGGIDADAADASDAGTCPFAREPNADLSVTSPLGTFTGGVGVFGIIEGECTTGIRVIVAEDLATLAQLRVRDPAPFSALAGNVLSIRPANWDVTTRSWIGSGPAQVQHWNAGESVMVDATITIEELVWPYRSTPPAPTIRAQLEVDVPGWSGGGSFELNHCRRLDILCP
jgi:hypothetical protein